MKDLKELWDAIKPRNKEEKIELAKDIFKGMIIMASGALLIYLGFLLS